MTAPRTVSTSRVNQHRISLTHTGAKVHGAIATTIPRIIKDKYIMLSNLNNISPLYFNDLHCERLGICRVLCDRIVKRSDIELDAVPGIKGPNLSDPSPTSNA